MKVLSLFDGISCGMVALERAGIKVSEYHAYEIDKYAIQISEKNYPEIIHHGNVFDGDFTQYQGFDLLIGGSPCTYWSIAKRNREVTCDGEGFNLFSQYVRALRESKCKYFLYENNFSIHQDIKDEISRQLGCEPIMINSSLLSAQHRKRCYWTNIPNVIQPKDKGILLKDILETGVSFLKKSYCVTANYHPGFAHCMQSHRNTMVAVPINTVNGKAHTIPATYSRTRQDIFSSFNSENSRQKVAVPINISNGNSSEPKSNETHPLRIGHFGKGGQGQRIYSVRGKSVCIQTNGGGRGAKTGLYEIDLPDGDYIIRKLTPIEAERCQTLPDNYTEGVSNVQRYKCIGNGWTVDVIAHILSGIKTYEEIKDSRANCSSINEIIARLELESAV